MRSKVPTSEVRSIDDLWEDRQLWGLATEHASVTKDILHLYIELLSRMMARCTPLPVTVAVQNEQDERYRHPDILSQRHWR